MKTRMGLAAVTALSMTLVTAQAVTAQQRAVPRGDAPSPAPAPSSSGSGGSDSSGSSGSGSTAAPPPSMPSTPDRAPSRVVPADMRVIRSGATPRSAPSPGGVISSPVAGSTAAVPDSTRTGTTPTTQGGRVGPPSGPIAQRRTTPISSNQPVYVSFPLYGPWGSWYPWYGPGFGYGLGFVTYNPWAYGATDWMWNRYGLWYDPYAYSMYTPVYGLPYGYGDYRAAPAPTAPSSAEPGSLRLRVGPGSAQVYVDGALAGTVSEFSGLVHHLELPAGRHQLEFRADGYAPLTMSVDVSAGRTLTARASLKKDEKK